MDDPDTIAAAQSIYLPGSDSAHEWNGWGTALKPAFEPIVLARKPLSEATVAANVLKWRTGALNIDGCRVETEGGCRHVPGTGSFDAGTVNALGGHLNSASSPAAEGLGRWPANVVTDGSDEVVGMFPSAPGQLAPISTRAGTKTGNVYGKMNREGEASADRRYTERGSTNFAPLPGQLREPVQSAARFFYSAKASKADRNGSKHPTVKPISLIQWLARLITPPGGTILDPFAGSGTTGEAARREGFCCILVEREAEYVADIQRRLGHPPLFPPDLLRAELAAAAAIRSLQARLQVRG
jgi:site-specific DNA-methyltransferase (adenine-specific)